MLTGAGVSAASGVPTFRGTSGLWRRFRPEELATPGAFARDPRLVWEWYDWRRQLLAGCRPNRAHEVLAAWSRRLPNFTLITQNVDDLHEVAGARHVIRLHGSIWHVRCQTPCRAGSTPWLDDLPYARGAPPPLGHPNAAAALGTPLSSRGPQAPLTRELPPRCPYCDALLRPAVVWFGESLDPKIVERASAATDCDLFFAIGTSGVVYPAAGLLHEAKRRNAFTVEINPEATDASPLVDLAIAERAEIVLDRLDSAIGR